MGEGQDEQLYNLNQYERKGPDQIVQSSSQQGSQVAKTKRVQMPVLLGCDSIPADGLF